MSNNLESTVNQLNHKIQTQTRITTIIIGTVIETMGGHQADWRCKGEGGAIPPPSWPL